ncbi:hypothetical protein BE964_20805 [Escherichia coli]|nr:hypothetical protein B1200_11390 [Escherichia coli]EWY52680.1 hypothetical protein K427_16845 [Escherichia coli MP1]AQV26701.1 hypothetical protein BE964_20805 [Escherichia coli]AQV49262.1 hypothetical protein BE966_27760 [Escherichia coli]AQV58151.1 hypothetical protein BE941_17785 [Escherichia coli]
MPHALRLSGLKHTMQYFELARFCRPDKAFTPHPAFCARGWLLSLSQSNKATCFNINPWLQVPNIL